MLSKPANRWQPHLHSVIPKKARPTLKAVLAQTDATTTADLSVVANATQVVHEGIKKNTPEEIICTSRQKALAADIDLTSMAQSTSVADASQVDDRKKSKRRRRTTQSKHSQRGDGTGKGVGAKSQGQKLNQTGSANAERPGKSLPRAVSSCVASEETDAQYLAEVAQTNAVLANFKRRRRERHSKSCQVGVKLVRRDDSL